MPAQTDARGEALRCAREAARVVLAKHPCVTGGGGRCDARLGEPDLCLDGDRVVAAYQRREVGRGRDPAWDDAPMEAPSGRGCAIGGDSHRDLPTIVVAGPAKRRDRLAEPTFL